MTNQTFKYIHFTNRGDTCTYVHIMHNVQCNLVNKCLDTFVDQQIANSNIHLLGAADV